jgi:hypothetical protein
MITEILLKNGNAEMHSAGSSLSFGEGRCRRQMGEVKKKVGYRR